MNDYKLSRRNIMKLGASLLAAGAGTHVGEALGATGEKKNRRPMNAELIAPGVWRIRMGEPETSTPLRYRSAKLQQQGFQSLPTCDNLPFQLRQIEFRSSARGCAIELPLDNDERIYGLGLNTQLFDKTNRRNFVRPTDHPENDLNDSHAPVPFYVSTRGYGVYVDTARYASFYAGNVAPLSKAEALSGEAGPADNVEDLYKARELQAKTLLVDVPVAEGVDIYIFGGPAMGDAVCRYNLFSGGGCVPPLWGLGMAYRGKGDYNAQDSLQLARSMRELHIPCDIWGVEPGWQTKAYSSSFVWNTSKFANPDEFIAEMHALGYHTSFWEHAFTHPESSMFARLKPFSGNFRVWDGLVPDFSLAGTRRAFQEHHEQVLFSKGADSMKLDECDHQPSSATPWSFPEASQFPSGLDGEQYHSLFGVLYQQTLNEPLRKRNRRTWGLVRNSHALAAPLPYVVYSDSYDLRCYVRGLVNAGFSGLMWTPEVRDANSVTELYRRIGAVIFSPYAMVNAWYMKLPPWLQIDKDKSNRGEMMPDHEAVTAIVRSLFELRMSLIPYLYSAFNEYHRIGKPPVRALVMDWPDDAETHRVDDQFLFGPSLMVAPIITDENKRSVYLPPGQWYDFWTNERLEGGRRIDVVKPPEQVPLFVRDNSLLPIATPVEHIEASTRFDLTIRIYGNNPVPFRLYADDGQSYDYEKGKQSIVTLTWEEQKGVTRATGDYPWLERYALNSWRAL